MTIKPSITIDDIARELGVSKTTVSRAISGKGRISAATRERGHISKSTTTSPMPPPRVWPRAAPTIWRWFFPGIL